MASPRNNHGQNVSESGCCSGVKHVEVANGREAYKDCETNCICVKNILFFGEIVVKKLILKRRSLRGKKIKTNINPVEFSISRPASELA